MSELTNEELLELGLVDETTYIEQLEARVKELEEQDE